MTRHGCRYRGLAGDAIGIVSAVCISAICGIALLSRLVAEDATGQELSHPTDTDAVDLRLEWKWQSATPRIWAGEVRVVTATDLNASTGRVTEPVNLTPGPLMSGGISVAADMRSIKFSPTPSTEFLRDHDGRFISQRVTAGGIIFRVRANKSDRVVISVRRDNSNEPAAPIAIPISELANGRPIETRFSDSATWSLKRVAGDRLRVELGLQADASTSLFWDDETATIHVTCDGVADDALELSCDVFAGGERVIARQSWPVQIIAGRGSLADAKWQPPKGDSAYQLRWRLQRPAQTTNVLGVAIPNSVKQTFTNPMAAMKMVDDNAVLRESVQSVVVLSRTPAAASSDSDLIAIGRVEPFGRSWSAHRYNPVRYASRLVGYPSKRSEPTKISFADATVARLDPGSYWEQTIPIAKVGQRHRVRLTFPDGQAMRLGVCIVDQAQQGGRHGVLRDVTLVRNRLRTGTSTMASAEIDYYPQTTSPQLFLINRDPEQTVMFEAIDVLSEQPNVAPIPTSHDSERETAPTRQVRFNLSATQWIRQFGDFVGPSDAGGVQFGNPLVAAVRLVDHVKRGGYAGVVMTVCEDGASLYPTNMFSADATIIGGQPLRSMSQPETLELLLRLFDRESLTFVPCVRANAPMTALEQMLSDGGASARGLQPANPWNGFDVALGDVESMATTIYNPLHPGVVSAAVDSVSELAAQVRGHACVPSIGICCDEGSCFRLPDRRSTMDGSTIDNFFGTLGQDAAFGQGTGGIEILRSQIPVWINDQGAATFDAWRAEQLRALYRRCLASIDNDKSLVIMSSRDQLSPVVASLAGERRIELTKLHRRGPLQRLATRCRDESLGASANVAADSSDDVFRAASFISPRAELVATPGDREVMRVCGLGDLRFLSTEVMVDDHSFAQSLARIIGRGNYQHLLVGTSMPPTPTLKQTIDIFNHLPVSSIVELASNDEASRLIKVQRIDIDDSSYVVAINQCRWNVGFEVEFSGGVAIASVAPTQAGEPEPMLTSSGQWRGTLAPGGMSVVRISPPRSVVTHWSAGLNDGQVQSSKINETVGTLAEGIAANTEPQDCQCIFNGSFEMNPTVSPAPVVASESSSVASDSTSEYSVPGWMMAQHSTNGAILDKENAIQGKRSLRLSNRDGRPGGTWMVSRPIEMPASGRLAVSVMLRGQPATTPPQETPIKVRIAIEGVVAGSAMRQMRTIDIPRDGKWTTSPQRVEIESLPRCGVENLRVAIDVMSEGTVWVDDIKSESEFLTSSEKTQLQSQVFLALGGISKGEWSHASRLLESHWVQHMLNSPPSDPRPVIIQTEKATGLEPAVNEKVNSVENTPGIADRIKGWLPRPMRF